MSAASLMAQYMHNNVRKDLVVSLVIAALGAGVITSFAVNQGQNPFIGLGITAVSALFAVTIDSLL
ncbi:MAG: hypothetical protein AAGJ69_04530 [Cyanobacteria bacterium J06559_1]